MGRSPVGRIQSSCVVLARRRRREKANPTGATNILGGGGDDDGRCCADLSSVSRLGCRCQSSAGAADDDKVSSGGIVQEHRSRAKLPANL